MVPITWYSVFGAGIGGLDRTIIPGCDSSASYRSPTGGDGSNVEKNFASFGICGPLGLSLSMNSLQSTSRSV